MRQYEHFHFCMPGEPAHCNVDLLEPDGEQVDRKIAKKEREIQKEKKNACRFTEKYLDMVIEVNLTVMLVVATL